MTPWFTRAVRWVIPVEYTVNVQRRIGNLAVLLAMSSDEESALVLAQQIRQDGYQAIFGKAGAMDGEKIVAAIETAAKRQGIISSHLYRESHALYHAIIDALHGVTRGQIAFGEVHRTVGVRFSVLRGVGSLVEEGEWLAVAVYGMIGAPVKGFEHEAIGLGIFHI